MDRPLLIAHRGASAEAPENTLAAFARAMALHADGIELDVQVTRDGVPVVFHDASLHRLTGRRGRVTALTWRELQELRVGGTERIPCLAEVLAAGPGRTLVQVELKRGATVAPVVQVVREAPAEVRVILASFEPPLLRAAAALAPAIPRMLISAAGRSAADLLGRMTALAACGLSLDHRTVPDPGFVREIRRAGADLWCWTVNDPAAAQRLAGWGVTALLTDNPALLKAGF